MSIASFPKQKVKKAERTEEWGQKSIDALINASSFGGGQRSKLLEYYQIYNGILNNDKYYSYVTNPLGSDRIERRSYPARIRNYNIIKPVIDLLLGEKGRRPANSTVICTNADVNTEKERHKLAGLKQLLEQKFINDLNAQGIPTGVESRDIPTVQEWLKNFEASYKDGRAILGQDAMDYIQYSQKLDNKFLKGFFDYLVTGYVYSYKGVAFDDVEYDIISPLFLDYSHSSNVDFVEDSDWAVRYCPMSLNQVIDNFHDVLTDDQLESLESDRGDTLSILQYLFTDGNRSPYQGLDRMVDVYHVVWKTFVKTGILYYVDELGFPQRIEVSEDYKPDEGEYIEWFWKNVVYQGYRIGRDIYVKVEPFPVQREDGFNPAKVKLPYNGRAYSNRHAENISVLMQGLPFQILYNIFHYRLELSIAKNKDKVMLMEYNTVPRQHGWDEEDFLYNLDAHSIGWIDTTAEGANGRQVSFNQFQVLDMSLWNYISKQYELINAIKTEWEESLGISRQRKGNVMASDGQGTTERAVYQSSIISEDLFRKFEEFEESELNGLLDTSKWAWLDGLNTTYINRDFRPQFLQLDPITHANAKYGVFVTKSAKELEKLNTLRQFGLNLASNTRNPQFLTEMLDSTNFSMIKQKFAEMTAAEREYEMQLAQQQNELKQMEMADKEAERKFKADEHKRNVTLRENLRLWISTAFCSVAISTPTVYPISMRLKNVHSREKSSLLISGKGSKNAMRKINLSRRNLPSKKRKLNLMNE